MKFKDAKLPQDTVEAIIREETHGDLVEVEIQADVGECVYLDRETAYKLGEHLIRLSRKLT